MQLNPYLNFNGDCEAALKYYEQHLGGKIEAIFRFGDTPAAEAMGANWKDKIMHARLTIGDSVLMASDCPPGHYEPPQGLFVSLHVDSAEEAERIFGALAEGGEVKMPIQQTFWATRFGMVVDKFKTPWMINCE